MPLALPFLCCQSEGGKSDCIECTICVPLYLATLPCIFDGSIKPAGGKKENISDSYVRKPSLDICLLNRPK